ncbi:MAG: NAD(P)-dependent oxidoreductase [Candidatus Brocadiae bacterium]|nr:NAD(P)-dependent oxidoreductase [Candidatus Brocadiia bacterium]
MKITDVETTEQLRDFMTTPTDGLVQSLRDLEGDILVLGAAGKVGPELLDTVLRANEQAGTRRTVAAADLFLGDAAALRGRFEEMGVDVHAGDFTERSFLDRLPDYSHVIFMAGIKFGTSGDWRNAFHLNSIMPYLVGERFSQARIVVFSSGNPYPLTRPEQGGCKESDELEPQGVYGWGIVARESAFATTALKSSAQKVCFFRLMYAQHLSYGVLVDLARMVRDGEPVSLAMPAVNLISQRDAIDVALRALRVCGNPPVVLNCAGPTTGVRYIVEKMGRQIGCQPHLVGPEPETALVANDDFCLDTFGPYRDGVDDMIEAAANWVMMGGEDWDKPTMFGKVVRDY